MASTIYWAAGAALGLAEGTAYAVEQLCPGGTKLTQALGLSGVKRADDAPLDSARDRGGAGASSSARSGSYNDTAGRPGSHSMRHLSSYPVDDMAPCASTASIPDAPTHTAEAAAPQQQSPRQRRWQQLAGVAGEVLRVPRLKLGAVRGNAADVSHGADVAATAGPSRLTEQNVSPFNVAFDAARMARPGALEDRQDALTIATMNRYTYGLGEAGVASASAPATPRSGAASDSVMGGLRRKQGLFRGLRRKGQQANKQVR